MEAARLVQQVHFERWKANEQGPFADTTSQEVWRQRIAREDPVVRGQTIRKGDLLSLSLGGGEP
jgi:cytochrome P450